MLIIKTCNVKLTLTGLTKYIAADRLIFFLISELSNLNPDKLLFLFFLYW